MGLYARLAALEREGGKAVLATVIRTRGSVPRREGAKMLILADGTLEGTVGGGEMEARVIQDAQSIFDDGKSRTQVYSFVDPEEGDVGVCGGEMEVFMESVNPNPKIVIVGGGHVGKAVAHLATWLGFGVVVVDDRPEYTTPEAVPDARERIHCASERIAEETAIHNDTYVILTTRGVEVDVQALPGLLDTPAAYIGVIGSRRRWETTVKQLVEHGIAGEKIQRVTSPIGLELDAETPEEIAVSIMAQIIMLRRGGSGESMAHTPKSVGESEA